MNEVVKYHNDLNMLSMGGLSEIQVNILFTIFAKIRNNDDRVIRLKLDEIIHLAGLSKTNPKYINEYIFPIFKKIHFLQFRYFETEYREAQEVIFPKVVIDKKSQEFEIKISKEFVYLFNNLVSNFTRFELAEFVNLSSKYAKTLYRLLKQYRHTGIFEIKWDKFVDIMDIPSNYRMFDIERQILKPITKELQKERNLFDEIRRPFKNLKFEKCKTPGKGNKITHIKFTFEPQTGEQITLQKEHIEDKKPTEEKENFNSFTNKKADWTNLYTDRYFVSKGNNNEYDTCKILRITKTDECYLLTAKNQENNSQFTKEFETKLHFENWYKKVQY